MPSFSALAGCHCLLTGQAPVARRQPHRDAAGRAGQVQVAGGADAGHKILQSSVDEGGTLITEDEPLISDNHVRKDYLVLNEASGRKQVYTEGGWIDEARATSEKLQIITSQKVFVPETNFTTSEVDGDAILLETGESEYLVLDGFSSSLRDGSSRMNRDGVRSARGLLTAGDGHIENEGERILLQGEPARIETVAHENV